MPLFHFVFNQDVAVKSTLIAELSDHEQALEKAKQCAHELGTKSAVENTDATTWIVRIYNDAGMLTGTVFCADLLKAAPGG